MKSLLGYRNGRGAAGSQYIGNLTSDAQTQLDGMAKLAGRSGGQILSGGTSTTESLTLKANATDTTGSVIVGASNQMIATANGVEFGSTTAATHPATFPSSSTGTAFYNTADQTTNYSRFALAWSSNVFGIRQESGGTDTNNRVLRLQAGSSSTVQVDINSGASGTTGFVSINRSTSAAGTAHLSTNGTSTASSGTTVGIIVANTINHSGTAGYTAILANITETSTGSGTKRLLDLQVGSASRLNVDNNGYITASRVLGTDSTVASGNDITLTTGNSFTISGTTQINTIASTNWSAGSIVNLSFQGSLTVKHATSGTGAQIRLAGAADFSATANDNITLKYNGTTWDEIARTVI